MSHHASSDEDRPSNQPSMAVQMESLMEKIARAQGAGPTGEYPRGKILPSDEGQLGIAVTVQQNTVLITFGKLVSWVGFSRAEAIEFATLIIKRAESL